MKRIFSILLALMMIFSLAITSYANTIVLEPVAPEVKEFVELPQLILDEENTSVFTTGEGGTYYLMLDPTIKYENVEVSGGGYVKASVFKYDPEKHMPIEGISYCVVNRQTDEVVTEALGYFEAKEKAEELRNAEKTTQYTVKPYDCYVNIFEIVIEDNYSASYKEGKVSIKALNAETKKNEYATVKIVSDVTIFEYEEVKWAASNKDAVLKCGDNGYSDYETALKGYGDKEYNYSDLRTVPNATVISTTAFRAITGKNIKVETAGMVVGIKNVASGQKGVNFAAHPIREVDKDKDGKAEEVVFGFYGNQAIKSAFEITINTDYTWFSLREAFGLKVEENDIITYTVYKNGKPYASFEIDYADAKQAHAPIKLVVDNVAGDTLGEYSIQVGEAEHVAEEVVGETNPNTGAPTFLEWLFALIFS